ncbi:MAG: hypothetical protein ABI604_12935 [Nitrospirota bacterium]
MINGKFDARVSICPNEFDSAREKCLDGDLAVPPSLFPGTPDWQGECLKPHVGSVNPGDGPVAITEYLGFRRTPMQTMIFLPHGVVV